MASKRRAGKGRLMALLQIVVEPSRPKKGVCMQIDGWELGVQRARLL